MRARFGSRGVHSLECMNGRGLTRWFISAACILLRLGASAENIPAGNVFDGVGVHAGIGLHLAQAMVAQWGPGIGLSVEAQIEWNRFLVGGTLLVAGSGRGPMIFFGGRSAIMLVNSEHAPFVGFGMGQMFTAAVDDECNIGRCCPDARWTPWAGISLRMMF
jgi:hypothetical protein